VQTAIQMVDTPSPRPLVLLDPAAMAWASSPSSGASVHETRLTAVVVIPTVEAPHMVWRVGLLAGERRLLSDDIRALESAASLVGRRVDGLRVARERLSAAVRDQRISRLATEAELRALRAQINPHFLFNALTTIGYLIRSSPTAAETTLLRLTALLRAVLRRTRSEFTTLGDELELVEAYLDIERARFEERLRVTIDVPAPLRALRIPSLLVQPLVENAVKHGVAPVTAGGEVTVRARTVSFDQGSVLRITVHDSGPGASPAAWARGRVGGLGLVTVEQRLACHFGSAGTLAVDSGGPTGTLVTVELPLGDSRAAMSDLEMVHG
jgi:two-component system LytT family sensor kinase